MSHEDIRTILAPYCGPSPRSESIGTPDPTILCADGRDAIATDRYLKHHGNYRLLRLNDEDLGAKLMGTHGPILLSPKAALLLHQ